MVEIRECLGRRGLHDFPPRAVDDTRYLGQLIVSPGRKRGQIHDGLFALVDGDEVDLRVVRKKILRRTRGIVPADEHTSIRLRLLERAGKREKFRCANLVAHGQPHHVRPRRRGHHAICVTGGVECGNPRFVSGPA